MRFLPEKELFQLYTQEFYTYQDLARHFKCSTKTIRMNIEKYQIPKIPCGNRLSRKLKMSDEEFREYLVQMYWKESLSIFEIAERLDTYQATIWNIFNKFGIKRRFPKRKV